MMDAAKLGEFLRARFIDHPDPCGRTIFRLETLDLYDVPADAADLARYVAGEPEPEPQTAWLRRIEAEIARGLYRSRVHVVEPPLSDYVRFECEWGYVHNAAAGEDVRILDLSETRVDDDVRAQFDDTGDFWLINDEEVIRMHYDAGRFVGAVEVTSGHDLYRRAAHEARAASSSFTNWWARHPEHHRGR